MKNTKRGRLIFDARSVALIGIMTATLTCGKLVLASLPNIEVVTLLCALWGYSFGIYGVIASGLFVMIEPLIYGIGSWLISYIIYWPTVAIIFMLLGRKKINSRWIFTATAVGLTLLFGILSSVIDSAFYLGINEHYFTNLVIYYIRGSVFYAVQTVTNAALFLTLFPFLLSRLRDIFPTLSMGKRESRGG